MDSILGFLTDLKNHLWGGPLLALLILVGIWLTIRLKGMQFRYLPHALSLLFKSGGPSGGRNKGKGSGGGDLSSFESLMTALAGAVGTGNITGIAVAMTIGGYGSLFWMWLIALFGMVTAYAECLLAVKFRSKSPDGGILGGPMETLKKGLGMHKTAKLFAFFCILASFGIGGTVQSNSVAAGMSEVFQIDHWVTGFVMMILTAAVVLGGVKSIGKAAGILVPTMAVLYLGAGLIVICAHIDQVIPALKLIVTSALTGQAAFGGFLGAGVLSAIQQGVSNGIFANEAGLGSLSIAASSAQTDEPARQGMLAICGVFIATMLVCTMTGLVIAVTQVLGQQAADGSLITGSALTINAFNRFHSGFGYVVVFGMVFFAFTTVLAWAYYGEKSVEFLAGSKVAKGYRLIYSASVFLGVMIEPELVWVLANLANGCMAFPNLIAIFRLTDVVVEETNCYLRNLSEKASDAKDQAMERVRSPL